MKAIIWIALSFLLPYSLVKSQKTNLLIQKPRTVFIDKEGVIRWSDNKEEVALFGANYCLPSASDYRAAGYLTNDRKAAIDQDMAHFARMGWDGMRICLWGDWENSDSLGNLIINDHLDVMDYLIYKASERGIYILFTPITTYGSTWPDGEGDTTANGFSKYFKKSELGANPKAIAVQVNYIKQILNHMNPYTNTAIKDEPFILFIEMINEPTHHPEDIRGSVRYINALVDAVRSTGCRKILFHNYSQDQRIGDAIQGSKIQGVTFAWYPTGLVSGNTLSGNFLRTVDEFPPMLDPVISKLPRIVYEFDVPDTYNGYMYPAMARTYRSVGAQFAAMFSYDMLVTAPYNLGWQTHFLNMVYTPKKAVSAIISAEVMRNLSRRETYGSYPENTSFGPFRVSYKQNLSEMVTSKRFIYSNNTNTIAPNRDSLISIVGCGSSPVVEYEGRGIYFIDKIKDGTWRLEVYPDAIIVNNPFAQPNPDKVVSRLIYNEWPMTVQLPDLGNQFKVCPLNKGNSYSTMTDNGNFNIYPGVYILNKGEKCDLQTLPEFIGHIGMDEFVCNEPEKMPIQINLLANNEYQTNQPVQIKIEVVNQNLPEEVNLYIRGTGNNRGWFQSYPMKHVRDYTYASDITAGSLPEGWYEYAIGVKLNSIITTFPANATGSPLEWGFPSGQFWKLKIVEPSRPLILLDPEKDVKKLSFTRIGDNIRWGIFQMNPSDESGEAICKLYFPKSYDKDLDDYTISLYVNDMIGSREPSILSANTLKIRAKGSYKGQEFYVTLVEEDGTSWTKKVLSDTEWMDFLIPISQLRITRGVKLPQAYPERWSYWMEPAADRRGPDDKIQLEKVERLQISLRPSGADKPEADSWIELSRIVLLFE